MTMAKPTPRASDSGGSNRREGLAAELDPEPDSLVPRLPGWQKLSHVVAERGGLGEVEVCGELDIGVRQAPGQRPHPRDLGLPVGAKGAAGDGDLVEPVDLGQDSPRLPPGVAGRRRRRRRRRRWCRGSRRCSRRSPARGGRSPGWPRCRSRRNCRRRRCPRRRHRRRARRWRRPSRPPPANDDGSSSGRRGGEGTEREGESRVRPRHCDGWPPARVSSSFARAVMACSVRMVVSTSLTSNWLSSRTVGPTM